MADVFTPEKRSEVMSRIRGGGTKPELAVRSMLHRMGDRFPVKGPLNRTLPGRPEPITQGTYGLQRSVSEDPPEQRFMDTDGILPDTPLL